MNETTTFNKQDPYSSLLDSTSVTYIGSNPVYPGQDGYYYVDNKGEFMIYDTQTGQYVPSNGVSLLGRSVPLSNMSSMVYGDESDTYSDSRIVDLLNRTLQLKLSNTISVEKAFNILLMLVSKDPENTALAQEIILKLEDSIIDKEILK